jgi:3-oxoadipate enol-lactonase
VMERVEVNGATLACRFDRAAADAPWLVFGNSIATDASIWDAQAAAFAPSWNLLRYDQRGHGRSDLPTGPVEFDELGSDLLALLNRYAIARCVYVGLSMGVPTGLAALRAAPERFRALVFVDGQARSAANAAETWTERVDSARTSGMAAFGRATAARWLSPGSHAAKLDPLARMIGATAFEGFAACAEALKSYNYADDLHGVTAPTLFIAGLEDGRMPETMRALAADVAGARFVGIKAAGHVPCYERPEAVNAALGDFLGGLGAAP